MNLRTNCAAVVVREWAAMRTAVCGSAHGSVRAVLAAVCSCAHGSVRILRPTVCGCLAMRQCAAVCGSDVRQCAAVW
jgi:hypothetical protein